jgi:stage II sporulation protein AA (anti-sigma F factor antagonist)
MEYTYRSKETACTILEVPGRLDALTYAGFEEVLMALFEDEGRGVAIDFTRVDYISSAGLRALMRGLKRMKEVRGAMALFGVNHNNMEVLRISGFNMVFSIFDTEADALASLKDQLGTY